MADLTFTAPVLAALLGVTPRHVQQLAASGVIPKAGRGRYPGEAVTAYCRHLRDEAGRGPADFQEERARLTRAKADREELGLAARRHDLLVRADVDAAVGGAFARVRARLLAVPSSVAPLIVGADLPRASATVERAIHDALQELADTTIEDMTGGEAG